MMEALFVSLIDNEDRPLLVHTIGEGSTELTIRYNVLSNLALDFFGDTKGNKGIPPKYLFEMDEIVVYGECLRQKGLKVVIGMNARDDEGIESYFQKVRLFYLQSVINPFNENWVEQIMRKLDALQVN